LHTVQLPFGDLEVGKIPVALKTGYAEPYSAVKKRSQIVVVVNEDTSISCYDSKLKQLWQASIFAKDSVLDKFRVDDVAVSILPLPLRDNSTGVVVVGASMSQRSDEEHFELEEGIDMKERGDLEHPEMRVKSQLRHFNIHAFDASTGSLIWSHDGLDVRTEQYSKSLPQFAFKMDKRDLLLTQVHRAPSVPDWSVFRDSLIAELPHDWHSSLDTSLRIAHFERRHIGAGAATQAERPQGQKKKRVGGSVGKGGRFTGLEAPSLDRAAALPHDAAEHTESPNVLVAHTRRGLEVIALKSGAPIVSMALNEGQTYGDVDGDGVVDSVLVVETKDDVAGKPSDFAHDAKKVQHCLMMVVSGLPARAQLFNGSICEGRPNMQESLSKSVKRVVPEVTAASPLLLRTFNTHTGAEAKEKDVVIAVNTGTLTCYSGKGEFKWQLRDAPTWSFGNRNASAILFDMDSGRVDDLGKHDNVYAQILVTGEERLSLISREGEVLATAYLPKTPMSRPVLGDFDNDGITDIIVITSDAYLGYKVEANASPKGLFIAMLILSLGAVVIFVVSMRFDPLVIDGIKQEHSNKGTYSLVRSTDDAHID
jgi:hypothetical protein